jgi:Icc-related predicted phosphoesterase
VRIFYASDVHGSDRCFRKFLNGGEFYHADALILGGDIAGKAIAPLISDAPGGVKTTFLGKEYELTSEEEVRALEERIGNTGYYPVRLTEEAAEALRNDPDRLQRVFTDEIVRRVEKWMALADERLKRDGSSLPCFVNAGNDDPFEIDEAIRASRRVEFLEGRVVEMPSGLELASCGYANKTPWDCPRDIEEEELKARLERVASAVSDPSWALFNFHCPPFDSQIDLGPKLDKGFRPRQTAGGVEMQPVGSKSCRDVIEHFQPLMGLHGHLHESRGTVRIGRTLCVNPGSEYTEGSLRAAVIDIDPRKRKVKNCILTLG